MYDAQLLRSLVPSDNRLAFWPEEFAHAGFWDRALAHGAKVDHVDTAIGLAHVRGQHLEVMKLQVLSHTDSAQRALIKFHKAVSELKSVSSTEAKDTEFENDLAKTHSAAVFNVNTLNSFVAPLTRSDREALEEPLGLKALVAGAHSELQKATSLLCNRWDNMAKMVSAELSSLHPRDKEWKKYVLAEPDKEKMLALTKDEKLLGAGIIIQKVKKYKTCIDDHCGESTNTSLRGWHAKADYPLDKNEKQGSLGDLSDVLLQAKLVLAVANAVKIIHFKGPKTKDSLHILFMHKNKYKDKHARTRQ